MNDNNKQQQPLPSNIDLLSKIKSEVIQFEALSKITNSSLPLSLQQNNNNHTSSSSSSANLNHNINKLDLTTTNGSASSSNRSQTQQNGCLDDVFTIAEKAEKLLRELLDSKQKGTLTNGATQQQQQQRQPQIPNITTQISSTSTVQAAINGLSNTNANHNSTLNITQQPTALNLAQILNNVNNQQQQQQQQMAAANYHQQAQQLQQSNYYQFRPTQLNYPPPMQQQQTYQSPVNNSLMSAQYYATHPPPPLTPVNYPSNTNPYLATVTATTTAAAAYPYIGQPNPYGYPTPPYTPSPYPLHAQRSPYQLISQTNTTNQMIQATNYNNNYNNQSTIQSLKRKHFETRYRSYSNDSLNSSIASSCTSSTTLTTNTCSSSSTSLTHHNSISNMGVLGGASIGGGGGGGGGMTGDDGEDDDINIARERELKELKCKSVFEKMSVFIKYYQQFKQIYIQRIHMMQCSDQLKQQFQQLIKYLSEYENVLHELERMISEHERLHICKNNHRKTKKFFNKTKTFIRYDCQKRLQTNIFEYRRQINSQDRYAGMYDIIEMNNHLISLLPDIGVSIRRYINKCEKARQQEQDDNDNYNEDDNVFAGFINSGDEDSLDGQLNQDLQQQDDETNLNDKDKENTSDNSNHAASNDNSFNTATPTTNGASSKDMRSYESFSKGVDSLNRYLLKRVENEESIDELVKERIIKWINKRQAKYILIFSEVDKLLNQHKDGQCHSKFHSFLLFNLGKLVTVCDSYHQKLKELLYSTTIRRKKKRKKVKILPESMSDVFTEIFDLKRSLEHTKLLIKKCNEFKNYKLT